MRSRIARFAMRQRATAAVAVLLVVVMAGTALAASRGNAWRLGYVETLSAYVTGITGIHTAELLRIANTNTSSGARAIRAESRGTAAGTIYAKNSGGGPAAEFVTNAGRAPFKVNRSTKVVNLNADRVDGFDSSALVEGSALPVGRTLRGSYGIAGYDGYAFDSISFGNALPAAPVAHWIAEGATPPAECPGSYTNPQALPGHLCIYETDGNNISFRLVIRGDSPSADGKASPWGAAIYIYAATIPSLTYSWGTWAVTAGASVTTSGAASSSVPADSLGTR